MFPAPRSIDLQTARHWDASPDWIYEEKIDGVRAVYSGGALRGRARCYNLPGPDGGLDFGSTILEGELCRRVYHVFDITHHNGQDLRPLPLWQRRQLLNNIAPAFPAWMRLIASTRGNGGEFLEAVLAAGGEGVVAKNIHARYGYDWLKAKRIETHDCIVTAVHDGSVSLGQYQNGVILECGRVKARGVPVGSVVEVACHSRTSAGKLTEPRIVRIRTDKPAAECAV